MAIKRPLPLVEQVITDIRDRMIEEGIAVGSTLTPHEGKLVFRTPRGTKVKVVVEEEPPS